MITLQYILLFILALVFTVSWGVLETRIPISTIISSGSWMLLALRGDTITLYFEDGSSKVVGDPIIQYFFLAMAIFSLGALIMWYFGVYPPHTSDEKVAQ